MKNIKNENCLKFEKLILGYFRNLLNFNENKFIKEHIKYCENCRKKYSVMEKIYNKFQNIENKYSEICAKTKNYSINDYKKINENLSGYIDNELETEENLAIKKILIKNKYAKEKFLQTTKLIELLKNNFKNYEKSINFREKIRNLYISMRKIKIKS